nr:non-heme iron oxygenase ferredoxin subunit [Oscillochloris trichoides]
MPAMRIANLADVPENGANRFVVNGKFVAVFRVGADLYAIDDKCTHGQASLSQGELDTDTHCVACPAHSAIFDLRSGEARTLPAFKPVATYRVWVEDDGVLIEV